MRILLCGMTYTPHTNGQAVYTQNLAQGLAQRGHEVMVVTSAEKNFPRKSIEQGIQCFRLPVINFAFIHQDLQVPIASRHYIPNLIRQYQPQVVHLQDSSPLCQCALKEARRFNIPVIISHHSGPEVGAPFFYFKNSRLHQLSNVIIWKFIRSYLRQADLVTVPSRYSVSMLKEHGVCEKIRTVPCWVDLTGFRPMSLDAAQIREQYGLAPEKRIFLYVGRVDPEKKADILIEVMSSLKRDDVQLAIAGYGSEFEHLKQLVLKRGLQNKVKFLGRVEHARLPELINCVDFFIMPGDAESFSIATLEAMACSKPILAARASALPELVTPSKNGFLFRPSDPLDIINCMEKLLQCQEKWLDLGRVSMLRATRFNQEAVLKVYEETIQEVVHQKKNAAIHGNGRAISFRNWQKRLSSPAMLISLLILVFLLFSLFYDQAQAYATLHLADIEPLSIDSNTSLLVIAPHPDDELLAAGGLIQRVLSTGGDVHVILVTSGDGQYITPYVMGRTSWAIPDDYIAAGRIRQAESREALRKIGLLPGQIKILGYPDDRINQLWSGNWSSETAIRSPLTSKSKSPYADTYNPDSTYRGIDLFQDLRKLIEEVAPDILMIPHPEDTNPDHSAVSNFSQFAAAYYLASHPGKELQVLAYLVHYGAFPNPRSENQQMVLLPPAPLSNQGKGWVTFTLNTKELSNKKTAINDYISQQKIMPKFLRSFAQANELFYNLPMIEMLLVGYEQHDVLEQEVNYDRIITEPAQERFSSLTLRDTDLIRWRVSRLGDMLCFAAETRGVIRQNLDYRVYVKLTDGKTIEVNKKKVFLHLASIILVLALIFKNLAIPLRSDFQRKSGKVLLLITLPGTLFIRPYHDAI